MPAQSAGHLAFVQRCRHRVQHVLWIRNDRYAKVDRQQATMLKSLALDTKKPFYRKGRPNPTCT